MNIQIDAMTYGGAGTGPGPDNTTIAIPFTLPGEIVDVIGADIIQPSPDRIQPRCPHFGPCGGCQYQHGTYAAQIKIKGAILRDTFHAAGLSSFPAPQIHTAEPWAYRNRIRLRVATVDGTLRIGYNRRGSYTMLPIRECPIAAPLLLRAAESVLAIAGNLSPWARQLTGIELFTNSDQTSLQITFFLRTEQSTNLQTFCEQLKQRVPQLAGAGILIVGNSGRREQPGALWGSPGLQYRVRNRDYWVSRDSFFQSNRFLIDELVHLVTAGRTGALAWDLYAGVGLFSRALLETFTEVIGVETVNTDLAALLKSRAIGSTVADFLRAALLQRDRPGLIVVDPPRAGLGPEVCDLLCHIQAPEIVYVSCDPLTLARDLKAMVDSGYTLYEVHLVDLFPQTFHMETVVVLNR